MDEEHLRIARDLHLRSALTVPLVARGRVLGVHHVGVGRVRAAATPTDDLAFAEDLAKRAAIAIDNAELHSETLAAAVQLQHAVLPDGDAATSPAGRSRSHYSPSGRTEVGGDFYDAIPLERRPAGAVRRRRHGARRRRRGGDGPDAGGRPGVRRGRPDARRW